MNVSRLTVVLTSGVASVVALAGGFFVGSLWAAGWLPFM